MKKTFTLFCLLILSLSVFSLEWETKILNDSSNRVRSMCVFNEMEAFVCGYDSLFAQTKDGGLTWNVVSMKDFFPSEPTGYDFKDASAKGGVAMIVANKDADTSGVVLRSVDKGNTWTPILPAAFNTDSTDISKNPTLAGAWKHSFICVEVIDDNSAFVFMQWYDKDTGNKYNGIFKTEDGGTSWKLCNTPAIEGTLDADIIFVGNTGYFAGGSKSYLFKTLDGGNTWIDYTDDSKYGFIWGIKVLNENEVFILTTNSVFYSNTVDFSGQISISTQKKYSTDLFAYDKNNIITFYKHDDIHLTNDFGLNWSMVGDGSTNSIRKCDVIYNDKLYVLGDSKLYTISAEKLFSGYITNVLAIENRSKVFVSSGNLFIESNDPITEVSIYSISGNVVYSGPCNSNQVAVPVSDYTKGIYLVRFNNEVKKVVIK